MHNPVFLPADIEKFAELVKLRKLNETKKVSNRHKLAGRVKLLHEILEQGIIKLLESESDKKS